MSSDSKRWRSACRCINTAHRNLHSAIISRYDNLLPSQRHLDIDAKQKHYFVFSQASGTIRAFIDVKQQTMSSYRSLRGLHLVSLPVMQLRTV
jgi:hypothetical protein